MASFIDIEDRQEHSNVVLKSGGYLNKMTVSTWLKHGKDYFADVTAETIDNEDGNGTTGIELRYKGNIVAAIEMSPDHGVRFMNYAIDDEPEITELEI